MGNFSSATDTLTSLHSLDRDTEIESESSTCLLMAQHSQKFLYIQVEEEELFRILLQEYQQNTPNSKEEEQSSISKIFKQTTFRLVQRDRKHNSTTPQNRIIIEEEKDSIFFQWIVDKETGYIYCAICPQFVLEAVSPNQVSIQPIQSKPPYSLQQQWFITTEGYISSKAFENKILGVLNWSMKDGATVALIDFCPENSNNFKWKLAEIS